MLLSETLGLAVRTASGERLGRVHDVRAVIDDTGLRLTGLVVGRAGVLERLGIGAPKSAARLRSHDVVPWTAIARIDRSGVVVEDGTRPE